LGRRVGRQLSVVSDDLNKIGEMRKKVEEARRYNRAPNENDITKLISLEKMTAGSALGLAETIGEERPEAIKLREYAIECLTNIGREASYLGNKVMAAQYLERAAKLSYETAQLEAMAQQKLEAGQGRGKPGRLEEGVRRKVESGESGRGEEQEGGPRYEKDGREYARPENNRVEKGRRVEHQGGGNLHYRGSGHGKQAYSLSALMALAGVTMIILTGMPHLTGGVIGGSASGYVNMLGGFLILLAIGLYFVKRNRL